MFIVILAVIAMFVQDIIGVLTTQAEARNKAHAAALFDCLWYLVSITTTTISVTALQGHNLALKVAVVGGITLANYVGTWSGVTLGKRLMKEKTHGQGAPENTDRANGRSVTRRGYPGASKPTGPTESDEA